MSLQTRLIKPLDVLMLRGNKSFGDAGEHGTSSMPPSPSVLSGALRSFWLAEKGIDTLKFKTMPVTELKEPLLSQLGTPTDVGSFRLADCGLVRKNAKINERIYPLPSDLVLQKLTKDDNSLTLYALQPQNLASDFLGSYQGQLAILKAPAGKPEGGYWLNEAGFRAYLKGEKPNLSHLIKTSDLWKSDWRLGIALDNQSRTASDGQIYTTEAIALQKDIFLTVSITGANDFPQKGTLRLGGDGRAAGFEVATHSLLPTIQAKDKRIKLLLTSPAIFSNGSELPSLQDLKDGRIYFDGGSARVVTTSIPRHHVISGWDLAKWQPKPAERVVPTGAIYWLDDIQYSGTSLQTALQDLLLCHLDPQRKAEGYNGCILANWINH